MIIERRNRLKATSLNNFGYWTAPPYLRYAQFLGWIIPSREVEAFLHAATGRKNVVLHPPPPVRVGEARQLITPSFLSEVATKCHHLPSLVTQSRNLLVLPFLPSTSLVYHSHRSTSFNQRQSNIHLIFPLTLINIISVSDPVSRVSLLLSFRFLVVRENEIREEGKGKKNKRMNSSRPLSALILANYFCAVWCIARRKAVSARESTDRWNTESLGYRIS